MPRRRRAHGCGVPCRTMAQRREPALPRGLAPIDDGGGTAACSVNEAHYVARAQHSPRPACTTIVRGPGGTLHLLIANPRRARPRERRIQSHRRSTDTLVDHHPAPLRLRLLAVSPLPLNEYTAATPRRLHILVPRASIPTGEAPPLAARAAQSCNAARGRPSARANRPAPFARRPRPRRRARVLSPGPSM